MTPKEKHLLVGILLGWIIFPSSCASLNITTWLIDAIHEGSLVRKDSNGTIIGRLSYVEANGYRCYSESDDEAWRNRLVACCSKAEQ